MPYDFFFFSLFYRKQNNIKKFGETCRKLECGSAITTARVPLRSSSGLFVVIITFHCACGQAGGGWTGHDSASSGVPLGWRGVPGQDGCCTQLTSCVCLLLCVSITRSLSPLLVSSVFCNWFADEAGEIHLVGNEERRRGYQLYNRERCGVLILNMSFFSSSLSTSSLSWSGEKKLISADTEKSIQLGDWYL